MEKRITNPQDIDSHEIAESISHGDRIVLQFSQPRYTPSQLSRINALAAEFGPSLEVRFYGHYGGHFDGAVLEHLPAVEALSVDCLQKATNLEALEPLRNLKRLSLGMLEGSTPDILERLHLDQLERLILSTEAKKNIVLTPLAAARPLRELYLNGQTKGIEVLTELPHLEYLSLGSIPKERSLEFVNRIPSLRHLVIVLGGRENIHEIQHATLERLEILRVRGLNDLSNLPAFPALRSLRIEDQIRLTSITFDEGNRNLESLHLYNCKKLGTLKGIEHLARLRELFLSMLSVDLDALIASTLPPQLETVSFYTGNERENRRLRTWLDERGYQAKN